MLALKRTFLIAAILLIALVAAACGSSGSTTTGSSGSSTPTTAPSTSSAVVKTATATVKGKSETILTDMHGKTLYYFTPDTATKAACTGACASTWPPLLFNGSGAPTSATPLPGTLSVLADANGNQVEYNDHLLYTFSGDSAPGQTNGEGLFGRWFVATPNLAPQSAPQATPTSSGY